MLDNSTIAAVATPPGVGGIAVIRISGENAHNIADKVFIGNKKICDLKGYTATFGKVIDKDGMHIDECVALSFVAPHSFTGENVVEISCHGGKFISSRVLNALIEAGARPADGGEFTKRAFLNGKVNLAEAESVIELINSTGEMTRKSALAVKEGRLTKEIKRVLEILVNMGGELSAWADYPDDDVPQVDESDMLAKLNEVQSILKTMVNNFDNTKIYRDGVKTVIAGRPNSGKSTLMNLLSGTNRSIVTDIEGTTRDIVEETVMLGGIPLILADTAGIRETSDIVEKIGVELAKEKINTSELILAVFDGSKPLFEEDYFLIEQCKDKNAIAIVNKNDLEQNINLEYIREKFNYHLYISAIDETYLTQLEQIVEKLFHAEKPVLGTSELINLRQRESVYRAVMAVDEAIRASSFSLDAVTVMVEDAVSALLELTGEKVSETLVDNIFNRFCVGK